MLGANLFPCQFLGCHRQNPEAVVAEARGSTLIKEMELLALSSASRTRQPEPSVSGAVLDRRATLKGLVATAVTVTIAAALTYGQQRFRIAAEPAILVLAAVPLVELGRAFRRNPDPPSKAGA